MDLPDGDGELSPGALAASDHKLPHASVPQQLFCSAASGVLLKPPTHREHCSVVESSPAHRCAQITDRTLPEPEPRLCQELDSTSDIYFISVFHLFKLLLTRSDRSTPAEETTPRKTLLPRVPHSTDQERLNRNNLSPEAKWR